MKNKRERGSIVLFVTVSCIFIIMILMIIVMNLESKKQSQNKQIQQISKQYDVTEQDLEQAYSEKVNDKTENPYELYSVQGAEDIIAPSEIFMYEAISEPTEGETNQYGLSTGTAKITGFNPQYCNKGGYTNEENITFYDTSYSIKYNEQIISKVLVIPYEVQIGENMYTITEVDLKTYSSPDSKNAIYEEHWTGLPAVETIILPNTIEKFSHNTDEIADWYEVTIKNIILSNNLKEIDSYTFKNFGGLTSIYIPASVTKMGRNVFDFYITSNLKEIRCEAEKQPEEWNSNWKGNSSAEVSWGQKQ